MTKANISVKIARYEEYINPLENFFHTYSVDYRVPNFCNKYDVGHF